MIDRFLHGCVKILNAKAQAIEALRGQLTDTALIDGPRVDFNRALALLAVA